MPLKVTFELSDADLRHFRKVAKTARSSAKTRPEAKVIAGARKLLAEVKESSVPEFIEDRLLVLEKFIAMLEDADWALTGPNRERVLTALAYFNDPVDLIHDSIPGIGYLDDAIMVQLVVDDLRPDIEAFDDFCAFRSKLDKGRRAPARAPESQASLEARRKQLHGRMRRRRTRRSDRSRSRGSSMKPFSLW